MDIIRVYHINKEGTKTFLGEFTSLLYASDFSNMMGEKYFPENEIYIEF